jgi:mRNA interferase MazF
VALTPGQIVLVDWRGDGLPKEPNKLRPCVVVEDTELFDEAYPNVLIVPLTDDPGLVIPSLAVTIEPTPENGCSKPCYAAAHCVTAASKQRITQITQSHVTAGEVEAIRRRIAESLGL